MGAYCEDRDNVCHPPLISPLLTGETALAPYSGCTCRPPFGAKSLPQLRGGLSSSDLFLAHLVVSVTQSLEVFVQAEGVGQSQALADSLLAHISCRQSIRPVTGVLAHPDRQSSFGYKKRAPDRSPAKCEDNPLALRPTG